MSRNEAAASRLEPLCRQLGRRAREAELADEFESHVQMLADENQRRGMSPADARRAALLTFGGVEAAKEKYRGLPALDSLRQDIRYALRGIGLVFPDAVSHYARQVRYRSQDSTVIFAILPSCPNG